MNQKTLKQAIKIIGDYRRNNEEVLDGFDLSEIDDCLHSLDDELSIETMTIMLIDNAGIAKVIDITEFYNLQISYDNTVDPSILGTLLDLIYTPINAVNLIGYASPMDTGYWIDVILQNYPGDYEQQHNAFKELDNWIALRR